MPSNENNSSKRNGNSSPRSASKSVGSDKRYVKRDSKGQFVVVKKTKGDKMFEKVWQDIHERRDKRVG